MYSVLVPTIYYIYDNRYVECKRKLFYNANFDAFVKLNNIKLNLEYNANSL